MKSKEARRKRDIPLHKTIGYLLIFTVLEIWMFKSLFDLNGGILWITLIPFVLSNMFALGFYIVIKS